MPGPSDDEAESERAVDRLAGDVALHERLQGSGFEGSEYDYFANEVAKYGFAVIRSWVRSGEIAHKCAERQVNGGHALPGSAAADQDAVESVADDTVAHAIVKFREKVLLPGRWDPTRGASLKTFFIGQCLFQYPNARERWMREQHRDLLVAEFEVLADLPSEPGVDRDVLRALEVEELLGRLEVPTRKALVMSTAGHSHKEIAQALGLTPKAVERTLARARTRLSTPTTTRSSA